MLINNPKLNAREAADEFVRRAFGGRREVGQFFGYIDNGDTANFQLVDGVKWYTVKMARTGWEVIEDERYHRDALSGN